MKVTLLIPTWNEVEAMKIIMPQIDRSWCDQLLVIDRRSTDGSAEYAGEVGCDVLTQKGNGLRSAFQEAWPSIQGDAVITFSPDGNSPPKYIPSLIAKFKEGYDMVIGSRYYNGMKSEDDDIITAFGNRLFTRTMNTLFDWNYTDAMTMYRIYRKNLFYELNLDRDSTYSIYEKLFFTKIGIEPILSARFASHRLKGAEVPAFEPARVGGVRKLQIVRWGSAYMSQVLVEKFKQKWSKQEKVKKPPAN